VELAEHGTTEVLDRIDEVLTRAGVHRSASSSKLGRVLADRIPPGAGAANRGTGCERRRGRAGLPVGAGRRDPCDGPADPPGRPRQRAQHAGGVPPDAQHAAVVPDPARPRPHRRRRRRTALAGRRAGWFPRPRGTAGTDRPRRGGPPARDRARAGRGAGHQVLRAPAPDGRRGRPGRPGQRPVPRAARRQRRAAGRPTRDRRRGRPGPAGAARAGRERRCGAPGRRCAPRMRYPRDTSTTSSCTRCARPPSGCATPPR